MLRRVFNRFGFYKIDQLQAGGNCGCCGAWIPDLVIEKDWSWGVCKKCSK